MPISGRPAVALSSGLLFALLFIEQGRGFLPGLAPAQQGLWIKPSSHRLYVSGGDYNLFGGPKKSGPSNQEPRLEYDLFGGSSTTSSSQGEEDEDNEKYEIMLAELVFGGEDVREVVYRSLDICDEGFVAFLEKKIEVSTDLEERSAFRSLIDIVGAVRKAAEKAKAEAKALAEENMRKAEEEELRVAAEIAKARSKAQSQDQTAMERTRQKEELQRVVGGGGSSPMAQEVSASGGAAQSYDQLLEAFLGLDYSDDGYVRAVVDANYDKCSLEFLEALAARFKNPATSDDTRAKLNVIQGHIQAVYQERMSRAAERLQSIVKAGPLPAMLERIQQMAKNDEIDEPLVLLLETNRQQAESAGAGPAVEVFRHLTTAVKDALDEKQDPTKRLIRRLLRTDDIDERKEILQEALRPKTPTLRADGSKTAVEPEVSPPVLIAELQNLIRNFGNMEELNAKLRVIVEEAEEVSVAIYGKPMSVQEQQDYMWNKATVSVFDLEAIEKRAQATGEDVPWANDKFDHVDPFANRPGLQGGARDLSGGM